MNFFQDNSLKGSKLKPEIKERWLANLPNYPRTKGCLRDAEGYCCLAVLGDLAVADGLATWEQDGRKYSLVIDSEHRAETRLFPGCLLEWAFEDVSGLDKESNYDFGYGNSNHSLAADNDDNQSIESICQTIKTHF